MENIQDEYQKLSKMFETTEGRQTIEELWLHATNYEKRMDGHWYKKSVGMGEKISGFAIDISRRKHRISPPGYDHASAYYELAKEVVSTIDDYELVIFNGWLSQIEGWSYPFIFMEGMLRQEIVIQLEEYIFEYKLGLPLNSLYHISFQT